MIHDATNAEIVLADNAAEEYRRKGYEVSRECPLEFMPGFVADLVARKGDEVVVMEVSTRAALALNLRIKELAEILRSKPGWSFELLLVGEPEKLDSPEGARLFGSQEILQRIDQAERALELGLAEAAFVMAWSAFEAATRALVVAEGVPSAVITTPGHLLDQAVFLGALSRVDYDAMTDLMKYRNAIVHGFEPDDFGGELVMDLIRRVKSMVGEATGANPAGT